MLALGGGLRVGHLGVKYTHVGRPGKMALEMLPFCIDFKHADRSANGAGSVRQEAWWFRTLLPVDQGQSPITQIMFTWSRVIVLVAGATAPQNPPIGTVEIMVFFSQRILDPKMGPMKP